MTNQTIRIPIGQAVAGVVNTDTTVATINLRLSSGGGAVYNGTHIGDGVYEFTGVASGSYKVFSANSELTKISWVIVGESGAVLITETQTITGAKTFTAETIFSLRIKTDTIWENTSGAGVTVDGILLKDSLNTSQIVTTANVNQNILGLKEFNPYPRVDDAVPSPTDPRDVTTKDYVDGLDSLVVHKAGSETITGAKLHNAGGNIVVDHASATAGYSANVTVTDNKQWVALGHMTTFVNTQIQNYISGNIPAFQLSDTYRRVIYNGTQETNRTFIDISASVLNAVANSPSVTKQFFVEIQQDSNTRVSANTISSVETVDYVHLFAISNRIRIFGADDAFDGNAGKTAIVNLTTVWESGLTATPSFTGFVFEDAIFDIADNALDFISCEFRGNCQVKGTAGTWTMNNCTGSDITAHTYPTTTTGYAPGVRISGAYNQRDLGRKGANIASATNITAGTIGNLFTVTGTTNLETLAVTNWTEGSEVSLFFTGTLDVIHQASITSGIFSNLSGANITTTAGTLLNYKLVGTTWYQT